MATISSNAELMSALSMAVGGELIELAAGDYGSLVIRGMTFSSDVTIVSADPGNPAIVRRLDLRDSSHIVFDGILFDFVAEPGYDYSWVRPFWVMDSANITMRNSVFEGDKVLSASGSGEYGIGAGLHITGSDHVVVENNELSNFSGGLLVYRTTNLIVRANHIHSLSSDGMDFVAVDGVLIEGNWIHDFKVDPTAGTHPDMIQFWSVLDWFPTKNVTIRGNFLDARNGSWTQSLFMWNEVVNYGLASFEDYAYRNILIEDNVIYNSHIHGITVGETDGLVVRNNSLLYDVLSETHVADGGPRMNLNESSLNVTIEDNIEETIWNWAAMINQPSWTVGQNLFFQRDDPSGENYYGNLFVNALAIPASLADLRAVAGGVIELGGYGAAMTRADIPMGVGPTAVAPPPPPETDTCEADLVEALAVVADLEAQLVASQAALAIMTDERDVALGERDVAEAALVSMTAERDVALASLAAMTTLWAKAEALLVVSEAELVDMTSERDVALAERDTALVERAAALSAQDAAETQLAIEVAKIAEIHVISGG